MAVNPTQNQLNTLLLAAWDPKGYYPNGDSKYDSTPLSSYSFMFQDKWICFRSLVISVIALRLGIFLILHYRYVELR